MVLLTIMPNVPTKELVIAKLVNVIATLDTKERHVVVKLVLKIVLVMVLVNT